jgi:ubiquinone/menaquinone biosynthesis C-methylase UbiE
MTDKRRHLSDVEHATLGCSSICTRKAYIEARAEVHWRRPAAPERIELMNLKADVTHTADLNAPSGAPGLLLHAAGFYDLTVWLFMLGRERAFREEILRLARIEQGATVLDVGCGTGTLAIAAKRRVGASGAVHGVDASPEMLARAAKKARKAGVDATFMQGAAQALPFPDAHFDTVLSTLMLHHLPRKARQQCAVEMRRVLKPEGRALVVDFGAPAHTGRSFLRRFHRHGHVKFQEIIGVLDQAGLCSVESGAVGRRNLQYVLAAPRG